MALDPLHPRRNLPTGDPQSTRIRISPGLPKNFELRKYGGSADDADHIVENEITLP